MARYGNSVTKTTSTAAAPIATMSASASRPLRVYEIGITASTAVSGEVGIMRPANSPATPSGGQVGSAMDYNSVAGLAVSANAWATAPTAGTGIRRMVLPATVGAGVIWSFPQGIYVAASAFLVVWQYTALAVTYSVYFDYDED